MSTVIANHQGLVLGGDGKRLYGMDAELHLKREAQRDPEWELQVAKWVEKVVEEPLIDVNDLFVSLRSGVVLCNLINKIKPGTIPKFAKTKLLPLMEMDNIQLYLKACWSLGVPSGDFFIVSDLYHNKSIHQVIQNIVSLSRVAPQLGYSGEPLVAGNTGKDRVKAWETVMSGGELKRVEDLEAGTPAERITQLSVELGQTKHELSMAKAEIANVNASMKEMQQQHRADRERWTTERDAMQKRLKRFAPIDDGGDGGEGSLAIKAIELSYKEQMAELQAELAAEKKRYAALEARQEELKKKHSAVAAELSSLKFEAKSNKSSGPGMPSFVPVAAEPKKPAWMQKVAEKKAQAEKAAQEEPERARTRTRTRTIMAQPLQAEARTPLPEIARPNVRAPTLVVPGAASGGAPEEVEMYRGRLNTLMQVRTSPAGSEETSMETGFFFNAEDLDADGLDYLTEQIEILFSNNTIEDDANAILNEMLLGDSGRRTFTYCLKEKLRQLQFGKVAMDTGPFLQVLSLVNSSLTGMQLDNSIDHIAMTFLLGVSRSVYTTGSRSQMEEYLADHLRDHSVWNDIPFWEQHYFDVVAKAFKKKFTVKSLAEALSAGWIEEHLKFLSQFTASFAHEMRKWSLAEEGMTSFFASVYERLQLPTKYQEATKAHYERLNSSHATKTVQDSHRMRHVSMVMSTAQAARIMGNLKPGAPPAKQDTNILQGWLKRRVHVMWVSEWVDQVGLHLNFREFKGASNKRIVVNLTQISKVEVRQGDGTRTIYLEAGELKVTVAPVKDTQDELDYWLAGLRRMQQRYAAGGGANRSSPRIPVKDRSTGSRIGAAAGNSGALPVAVPSLTVPGSTAHASNANSFGSLKVLASKDLASAQQKVVLLSFWEEPRIVLRNSQNTAVGSLDVSDMTHMPEVDERRVRLHTKGGVIELGDFDPPDSLERWVKTLTAFKKKRALGGPSPAAASSASHLPAAAGSLPVAQEASSVTAHTYKLGDMVWCEFVDDKLWYRGVLYFLDGKNFKVVFIEYSNTQDCVIEQIRPIDDPAMLALAGKSLAHIVSPNSIDGNHPLTVQIPSKVAADLRTQQQGLRRGTILRLDPKTVLQQMRDEVGTEEPEHEVEPEPEQSSAIEEEDLELLGREESSTDLFDWALKDDEPGEGEDAMIEGEPEEEEQPPQEEEQPSSESKAAQIRARLAARRDSTAERRSTVTARTSTITANSDAAARLREKLEARKKDKLLDDDDDNEPAE